jgi:hypothetical protein
MSAMTPIAEVILEHTAFIVAALLIAVVLGMAPVGLAQQPNWRVCFTPGENCTGLVMDQIRAARRVILARAYGFTSVPILSALKAAHARGVDVEVIVDKISARSASRARPRRLPLVPKKTVMHLALTTTRPNRCSRSRLLSFRASRALVIRMKRVYNNDNDQRLSPPWEAFSCKMPSSRVR